MFWHRVIHALLTGTILSSAGRILTDLFNQNPKEVYHIRKSRADNFILTSISVIAGLVIGLILFFRSSSLVWAAMIPGILLMEVMAIGDLRFGQIPHASLVIAVMISIYTGILTSQLRNNLTGGTLGLILGLLISLTGKVYLSARHPEHRDWVAFGFGDVTGTAILGLLLGFPSGFWAFMIALFLAVIVKSISAVIQGQKPFLMSVRLGPFSLLDFSS